MSAEKSDHRLPWLTVSLLVLALDQWSKWAIEGTLATFERRPVIADFFNLSHVKNTGIAFGMLPAEGSRLGTAALALFGFLALGLVGFYFSRSRPEQFVLRLALVLVLGGALGNLLDRVLLGEVTDFFDFYFGNWHFWTFNVADSAISVGLVLLVLDSFLAGGAPAVEGKPEATTETMSSSPPG